MQRSVKAAAFVLLGVFGGVCQLPAQTANIGQLTLTGPNFGYQTVSLYNYSGTANGCQQFAVRYNVCNAVNIASWQLTITFTANAAGIASSPVVFTSAGAADIIGPTSATGEPYDGPAANPWTLSFDLQHAGCSPNCDAQISSIKLTGTLDTSALQLYDQAVAGPYILETLGSQNFAVTWNIPSTDYTANPDSLFDSTDIVISNQSQLTPQTITFGPLTDQILSSTPPALNATAGSGLAVTFVANSVAVCTVAGSAVTLVAPGTCSITASQPGDTTYAAATPVTQTFSVTLAPQTITFGPLTAQTLSILPPALTATASSGLIVSYLSNATSVCTVSGTTITLVASGTCSITAGQSGNAAFAPATPVTQTFVVSQTCDINVNGTIDISDVQLIINEALGTIPAVHDLNHDGPVNVADVQIVINAALGLGCSAH